ncbi:hypothetical protein ACFWN2_11055 [Lentzea sp. NPDC058436]|uniref:hypothetical protein n=1 Tax=Lentzea sp. NPDC058436 TaxID=3346499 RepID=UPI0036551F58
MDAGHARYGFFLDPQALPDERTVLQVSDAEVLPAEVARALEALYRAESGLDLVTITVGAEPIGACTRAWFERQAGEPLHRLGEGDRAGQPGVSRQFELLRFACGECDRRAVRLIYDDRDLPECSEHGVMGLPE